MTGASSGDVDSARGAAHRSFDSRAELGEAAAELIAANVGNTADGRPYLLGCPGGRTPTVIFAALGRLCAQRAINCSQVVIVMMDDYLEPGAPTPIAVAPDAHNSCRRFAEHDIRRVINQGLPPEMRIRSDSIWMPDPQDPACYDQRIAAADGVDLFLVASGASDGHVAFRGPGSDLDSTTAIVTLALSTRADNLATFPDFASVDEVPTQGVSVGLGTIRNLSRAALMVLHGIDKQESARRLEATTRHDPAWPATFIHECRNAQIWTDAAASPHRREQKETQ